MTSTTTLGTVALVQIGYSTSRARRGEYEITEYVTKLAERGPVSVVPAKFWLPIDNVEA